MTRSRAMIAGAVGGLYAAGAMSVWRLGMHRAGLIDKMVPQVVEEWLSDRLRLERPAGSAGHQVTDQLLHLAYGAGWGLTVGPLLVGRSRRAGLWRGGLFGLSLWAIGMLGVLPALRVARPAWNSGALENATNIAAHLLYGIAVQLLVEEPERQKERTRTSDRERAGTRVG